MKCDSTEYLVELLYGVQVADCIDTYIRIKKSCSTVYF